MKNTFITGKPGTGKTTALVSAVSGMDAGGFYTQEVKENGERIGFDIVSLSGDRRLLSRKGMRSAHRVGSYGVDVEAMDGFATRLIEDALSHGRVIVIDEIGKMELFSDKFKDTVLKALDSKYPVTGIIMEKSHPFVDRIKVRKDVEVLVLTPGNRDSMPSILRDKINTALYGRSRRRRNPGIRMPLTTLTALFTASPKYRWSSRTICTVGW